MSIQLRGLHPAIRGAAEYALEIARHNGVPVTVTSGLRSSAEQARLRRQYEACLAAGERVHAGNPNPACRFPANRPGTSAHEFGLAFDSSVPEAYWDVWNAIRSYVGFRLMANDRVHAEHPDWR